LASTLQTLRGEPCSNYHADQKEKDSKVIKIIYMFLLGSALILSVCALWLAIKELMTE